MNDVLAAVSAGSHLKTLAKILANLISQTVQVSFIHAQLFRHTFDQSLRRRRVTVALSHQAWMEPFRGRGAFSGTSLFGDGPEQSPTHRVSSSESSR